MSPSLPPSQRRVRAALILVLAWGIPLAVSSLALKGAEAQTAGIDYVPAVDLTSGMATPAMKAASPNGVILDAINEGGRVSILYQSSMDIGITDYDSDDSE